MVQTVTLRKLIYGRPREPLVAMPECPESAITFHKALRALNVSSLTLAHVAKNGALWQWRTIWKCLFYEFGEERLGSQTLRG